MTHHIQNPRMHSHLHAKQPPSIDPTVNAVNAAMAKPFFEEMSNPMIAMRYNSKRYSAISFLASCSRSIELRERAAKFWGRVLNLQGVGALNSSGSALNLSGEMLEKTKRRMQGLGLYIEWAWEGWGFVYGGSCATVRERRGLQSGKYVSIQRVVPCV